MAIQTIGIGTTANDGTGDTLRVAFDKVNDNFTELYPVQRKTLSRWYPIARVRATAGSGSGFDTIRFTPFVLHEATTITNLGVRISTTSASSNVQCGIYAADASTGLPTGAVLANTGNLSGASGAVVSAAIAQTSVALQPGTYWFGVNSSDATVAVTGIDQSFNYGMTFTGAGSAADCFNGAANVNNSVTASVTFGTWSSSPSITVGPAINTVLMPLGIYKVA